MTIEEDIELTVGLQAGEDWAFKRMFELCWCMIVSVGYKFSHDYVNAEDAAQQAFTTLYKVRKKIISFSHAKSMLLLGVKRNLINFYRQQAKDRKFKAEAKDYILDEATFDDVFEKEVFFSEIKSLLLQHIEKLKPIQKQSVLLTAQGLNRMQIAESLNANVNTINIQMHRVRKKLREMILKQLKLS